MSNIPAGDGKTANLFYSVQCTKRAYCRGDFQIVLQIGHLQYSRLNSYKKKHGQTGVMQIGNFENVNRQGSVQWPRGFTLKYILTDIL